MPLLYRMWMKIKAKHMLAALSSSMPSRESSYATMTMHEDKRLRPLEVLGRLARPWHPFILKQHEHCDLLILISRNR